MANIEYTDSFGKQRFIHVLIEDKGWRIIGDDKSEKFYTDLDEVIKMLKDFLQRPEEVWKKLFTEITEDILTRRKF